MFKTSPTQSAENLPSSIDGAEDAEVRSGTSSTTKLAKNSPSDMAEDVEVGGNGDGGDDKMVKKSPLSKKPNKPAGYLISLHSRKDEFLLIVLAMVEALS